MEPEQLANALKGEHPQAIALVVLSLPPERAGRVLAALPAALQADVADRMANTQQVDAGAVRSLLAQLKQRLGPLVSGDAPAPPAAGGVDHLAAILKHVDPSAGRAIVAGVGERDAALAERVRDGAFTFADLATLANADVQRVLRDVPLAKLALALRGAPEATKHKLLQNMSPRVRAQTLADMEAMGPQRIGVVRETQDEIARAARRLAELGEIDIGGASGDRLV